MNLLNLMNLLFFHDVLILLALCTHPRSKRLLLPAKDASKEHLVPQGNLEAKLDLRKKSHSFTAQHRGDQVI